jgi:hypothetical protein
MDGLSQKLNKPILPLYYMEKVKKIKEIKTKIKKIEKIDKKEEADLEDILDLDAEDNTFDLDSPSQPMNQRRARAPESLHADEPFSSGIEDVAQESSQQPAQQSSPDRVKRAYTTFENREEDVDEREKYITAERTTAIIHDTDEDRGIIRRGTGAGRAFQSEDVERAIGAGRGTGEDTHGYELKEKSKEKETKRKLPWEI